MEILDPPGGVNELGLAGEEGVGAGPDVDVEFGAVAPQFMTTSPL